MHNERNGHGLYPTTERYYRGPNLSGKYEIQYAVEGLFRVQKLRRNLPNTHEVIIDNSNQSGLKKFIAGIVGKKEISIYEPPTHVSVYKITASESAGSSAVFDGETQFPDFFNSLESD